MSVHGNHIPSVISLLNFNRQHMNHSISPAVLHSYGAMKMWKIHHDIKMCIQKSLKLEIKNTSHSISYPDSSKMCSSQASYDCRLSCMDCLQPARHLSVQWLMTGIQARSQWDKSAISFSTYLPYLLERLCLLAVLSLSKHCTISALRIFWF